jgi:hypothetical protein
MSSCWWVEIPPVTCIAVYRYTVCSCIWLDNYWHIFTMHGPLNVKCMGICLNSCNTFQIHNYSKLICNFNKSVYLYFSCLSHSESHHTEHFKQTNCNAPQCCLCVNNTLMSGWKSYCYVINSSSHTETCSASSHCTQIKQAFYIINALHMSRTTYIISHDIWCFSFITEISQPINYKAQCT